MALKALFSWLVTLLIPVALVLSAVRLLLTPLYINIEYNIPGFPDDPFGFSRQERLHWADVARQYLLNKEDISFLGDLRFPEGQITPPQSCKYMDDCSKLYNDRELEHMVDVKNVVQAALRVWYVSLLLLVGLGIWSRVGGWGYEFRLGVGRGGWLTALLLVGVLIFVLVAFGVIFVAFHNVFFASGTWTFLYSDTLIRLFPERFWRDIFLTLGLLAGGGGVLLGYLLRDRPTQSKRP